MRVEEVLSADELLRLECARIAYGAGESRQGAGELYEFIKARSQREPDIPATA